MVKTELGADAITDIRKPSLRIDIVELRRLNQRCT